MAQTLPLIGKQPENEKPAAGAKDTFCVLPWIHLDVIPAGFVSPCCIYKGPLSEDGSPMSFQTHSLDQMWNSNEMRTMRRDMVQGKFVRGCAQCYRLEAAGAFTMRQGTNQNWEEGWLNDEKVSIATLKAQAAAEDFRLSRGPISYQLDVGNLCNLKCRMCFSYNSSRIRRDPVHEPWVPDRMPASPDGPWYKDTKLVEEGLLKNPEHLKRLYISGGEPFLIKEVGDMLQRLIDAGAAPNMELSIQTNGSTVTTPWLDLAPRFKRLMICVSIDGYDKYYEYIRYPARWATLVKNIGVLSKIPKAEVFAGLTFQAYNMLNLVDLCRFLPTVGVQYFWINVVTDPPHLRAATMPAAARRLAYERLCAYAETDCYPANKDLILGLAAGLEITSDRHNEKLLRDFMLFTNDLDVSRGQSFRDTHPELLELITEAGVPWTEETLHAKPRALPVISN